MIFFGLGLRPWTRPSWRVLAFKGSSLWSSPSRWRRCYPCQACMSPDRSREVKPGSEKRTRTGLRPNTPPRSALGSPMSNLAQERSNSHQNTSGCCQDCWRLACIHEFPSVVGAIKRGPDRFRVKPRMWRTKAEKRPECGEASITATSAVRACVCRCRREL